MSSIFLPKLHDSALDGFRSARRALEDQSPAMMQNGCSQCGGNHDSRSHSQSGGIQTGSLLTPPLKDEWVTQAYPKAP